MRRTVLVLAILTLLATAGPASALEYVGGSTGKLILVQVYDAAMAPVTGLADTDVAATYTRNNAAADVDVTMAAMTLGTHLDGGWAEVDAINSPGLYQFGVPDAALAAGAEEVTFHFQPTGALTVTKTIEITTVDLRAANGRVASNVQEVDGVAVEMMAAELVEAPQNISDLSVEAGTGRVDVGKVKGGDATAALGTPQTGDNYPRIGQPSGSSLSLDVAALDSKLNTITGTDGVLLDSSLYTMTPQDVADAVATVTIGAGNTPVNHDTGGTDALAYTVGGSGIEGAIVTAYVKSEYDASTFTIRGHTTTNANGRWNTNLMLNSGVQYTLVFYKPGQYGPDTVDVTP